jgi:hypothetical protein
MTTLELGTVVQFSQTYSRHGKNRIGYGIDKYWRRNDNTTHTGIVVGIRTISNGTRKWVGSEEGYEYTPTEYLQAALVAFDLRRKPVLVPIDAVQVVNPTRHSYVAFWSDKEFNNA